MGGGYIPPIPPPLDPPLVVRSVYLFKTPILFTSIVLLVYSTLLRHFRSNNWTVSDEKYKISVLLSVDWKILSIYTI